MVLHYQMNGMLPQIIHKQEPLIMGSILQVAAKYIHVLYNVPHQVN